MTSGTIIGVGIGVALLIILVVVALVFVLLRRRRARRVPPSQAWEAMPQNKRADDLVRYGEYGTPSRYNPHYTVYQETMKAAQNGANGQRPTYAREPSSSHDHYSLSTSETSIQAPPMARGKEHYSGRK
ncbi:uncharacterized protein STEHIDRAFT_112809 [Stereum hirsutum FP-91666 SS1]|uniref:uncharacterized protein n=1 Tax=Stereum hirsutum (strain FP-91666) TaxID=721885 RepID=UPI000444A64E|nr:uncharacterized protein STEHIDRAFT_112809 [Stereum hirsutum FP-91666 SS1]EIM84433.1 hypothetical protein STEHIDRAFT_112809 [Stereum hirsutum FP-91666 SS1]